MQPFLSIVIANYNYGRFLAEAIESLLSQSCQDFEIIIIDGGSTDESVEVIKRYAEKRGGGNRRRVDGLGCETGGGGGDRRRVDGLDCETGGGGGNRRRVDGSTISYWVSEPDKGQSNAFNKGFAHASGRFLTWLNADDVMLPGTIEKLKRAAEKHPDCEWFVGGCFWLDPEMRIVNCGRGRPFSRIRYREGNVSVWGPSSFFTKRLLDSVGGLDERFHFAMDSDLWLRFAYKSNARYLPFCDYAWGLRLHQDAKMSGHNFSSTGELDLAHAEKEKIRHSKHHDQMVREWKWMTEGLCLRPSTALSHILSVSWLNVMMARLDLFRYRRRHYLEYFA